MVGRGVSRRVLSDLSHGGHAVDDGAPGAAGAVKRGLVSSLADVTQQPPDAAARSVATSRFHYLFTDLLALHQPSWTPAARVRLPGGSPIRSIADFLRFAGGM